MDMLLDEMARLDGIVRDFLEFSRPRALNVEPLQLASLLDETLDFVGRRLEESRINLVRKYSAESPSIMGDGKQLKQVFINLLNNAAEVTPGGGEIRSHYRSRLRSRRSPDGSGPHTRHRPGHARGSSKAAFRALFHYERKRHRAGTCASPPEL